VIAAAAAALPRGCSPVCVRLPGTGLLLEEFVRIIVKSVCCVVASEREHLERAVTC